MFLFCFSSFSSFLFLFLFHLFLFCFAFKISSHFETQDVLDLLGRLGWPPTHRDPLSFASQGLGLKVFTTMPGSEQFSEQCIFMNLNITERDHVQQWWFKDIMGCLLDVEL